MSLGKRLIGAGAGVVCNTDSVQAFGVDNAFSSNIALYQLDGNANDTTTNYDGTATDVTYSTGQFGQAAVFNGSSSRIIVEDSTANAFGFANYTGTASAWVNIDSFSSENPILSKRDTGQPGNRQWMLLVDTSKNINFFIYNTDANQQTVTSSTVLNANQWYHIAVTLTTSDVKIYINGVEDTTASSTYSTIQNDGADLQIGRRGTNTGHNYFDGKIDQVRIFNRAITPEEVSTLYNETDASNTNPLSDGSGVALYTLDYDASDAGGLYDGTPTDVEFGVGGQINYGARFNGSSSGITVNSFASLSQLGLSMWVNIADVTSNYALAARYGTNREFAIYNYQASNGFIAALYYNGNNSNSVIITAGDYLTNNTWHHIAFTANGSTAPKLYIDGVERGTAQYSDATRCAYYTSTEPLEIGKGVSRFLNGDIDQVRIFNKALSSDEVSTLYAETACVYDCTTDTVDFPTTNVAYYKLDNSAEDETGSYDGTETNIEYRFGRFGQAAVFNGISSKITTSYTTNDSAFTISGWIKHTSTTFVGKYHYLAGKGYYSNSSSNNYWQLVNYSSEFPEFRIRNGGASVAAISGVAMNLNQWHHLVGTVDSSGNMKIYLDGVLTGSATGAPSRTMTQGINYGVYLDGTTYFHDGQIDQIRYYSTALDSDQVSQLYNEKPCADTSNFKTVLYEGTGSTQYISNVGMDLETDGGLVWVKKRDGVHDHKLADSVRGATKIIESSTADAEITATGSINAFNANGFEVGSDSSVNGNGNDFVAWVWKGGGDAVSNTNGDITSQVSANTDAGFSIVKYSGNTGANQTVGHGLSSTPEMVIVKRLTDSGYSWCVQHTGLTSMGYNIYLDDTLGELLRNRITAWNSTTFTVEQIHETNNTGEDYIAYCFHSVSGYSKIGSYTGAGSGTRVYTTSDGTSTGTGGFKPSWIMLKNASVGGTNYDWYIYDVRRNDNDGDDNIESYLRANLSSAEVTSNTGSNGIVMEDDGFTLDIAATSINGTGNTFIYMAFK